MASFLYAAACLVLSMAAVGLFRTLNGPSDADRMITALLIGTCGGAVLLLLAVATEVAAIIDVALVLELLAAFAAVAFVRGAFSPQGGAWGTEDGK
jgi:multicomponent Na+:H+ antiporter subunit F